MAYPGVPLEGTTPLISDRFLMTFRAGAAITIGQALYLGTNGLVYPTTGLNMMTFVGFAMNSQANVNGDVTVLCRGYARMNLWGTVAIADQLTTAPNGFIATDNSSKNTTIVGIAIAGGSSGGTGTMIIW